jgi:hypothetical protein
VKLIKALTSRLSSLGIDLGNREFTVEVMKVCARVISVEYMQLGQLEGLGEGVRQALVDVLFLDMVLKNEGEFDAAKEMFLEKVSALWTWTDLV